ncbi:hypothetical protein [Streptomyces sp. RKAG290]|uniref:hypothetical protein n=1 Tax=Streptomyces sp. RKAG290 TaxID=2888348 RepID=UPI00203375D3|nr:hypothetical protein [Streptomyces sp. RKAG290]MCM2414042.1 hypothetical protein [Streptomyces sp. RKAG290]
MIAHFPRERAVRITATFAAAATLALVGPFMEKFNNPICHATALIFSSGWAWACFAFMVGFLCRSKIESALLASSTLAVAVVVYYAFKAILPTTPVGVVVSSKVGDGLTSSILVWGIAAFAFGAPVGLLGNIARTPGIGGIPYRLLIPLVAFIETSARLDTEASSQGQFVANTWSIIRIAAVLTAVALLVHGLTTWRTQRDRPDADIGVGARKERS